MRYGKFVCVALLAVFAGQVLCAGCRDTEMLGEAAAGPPEALCVEVNSEEPDKVTLKSPACGGQCSGGSAQAFDVSKGVPIYFLLYGASGIEYCVEVERTSGYVTISHDRGVVTREGDIFTWCITPSTEDSEFMMVRSFTASAGFNLTVP